MSQYSDLQLDALRELANIGSGKASTALSSMLGRSVDITVPSAFSALPSASRFPEARAAAIASSATSRVSAWRD